MAITINGSTGIQMAADDSLGFGDIGLSQDTLFSGRKNVIINGDFDVWQRGTSGSHATAVWSYDSADRWNTYISTASTITLSQQAFALGQTDVPNEPTYFARFNWLGTAQSETKEFGQNIEGVRTFAGQNCTLSFYAKATTGVSGNVYLGQIFGSGGSPAVYKTQPITLTTSWQRYEFTFTLDSISGKTIGSTANYLQVNFQFTGTAGNNFDIAQVQLEKGSQATAFEKRSYGEELALCQRYYQPLYTNTVYGQRGNGNNFIMYARHIVPMRATPTGDSTGSSTNSGTVYLSPVDNLGTRYGAINCTVDNIASTTIATLDAEL